MLTKRDFLTAPALFGAWALARELFSMEAAAQVQPIENNELPTDVKGLLDDKMKWSSLPPIRFGPSVYYIVLQFDDEGSGEPLLIRKQNDEAPLIVEDFVGVPSFSTNELSDSSVEDVNLHLFSPQDLDGMFITKRDAGQDLAESPANNGKVAAAAVKFNNRLSSREARGTNRGRLACAWAVNTIVQQTLGAEVGGGLATANMIKVLKARHILKSEKSAQPGAIVISPTTYFKNKANIGHVGILGEGGNIYSNSSNEAKWVQNFTTNSWRNYYEGKKGLSVYFFHLDDLYF